MSKFIYLYKGPRMEMNEEEGAKWGAWLQGLGSALVSRGEPFGAGICVVDNGTTGAPSNRSGYSIVEANDLAHAQQLIKGLPLFFDNKGHYSAEIFELIEM